MPRGIADERDSADRTVTPTGNKTKMNGFVEISTLLIHSALKQESNDLSIYHIFPYFSFVCLINPVLNAISFFQHSKVTKVINFYLFLMYINISPEACK